MISAGADPRQSRYKDKPPVSAAQQRRFIQQKGTGDAEAYETVANLARGVKGFTQRRAEQAVRQSEAVNAARETRAACQRKARQPCAQLEQWTRAAVNGA